MVDDIFADASEAKIIQLCFLAEPLDMKALQLAARYVEEWRVVCWCREQNSKGIAPQTGALLSQFLNRRFDFPLDARPRPWGAVAEGSTRKRVTRFRKLWRGRLGAVRLMEDIEVALLREKVCVRQGTPNKFA